MIECTENPSFEPLNFGIVLFNPISSVPGSPSLFYLQPLLTGKVFESAGVLIGAELFLFLAQRIFGLEGIPALHKNERGEFSTVQMSIPELQAFLNSVANGNIPRSSHATDPVFPSTSGISSGIEEAFATPTTVEAPLIVGIAVYADYSNHPFAPLLFFTLPIFTLPGIRGSLPLLILTILSTIFVRAVVPPSTTGSRPLTEQKMKQAPIQLNPEELLMLLKRFGKYFYNTN